MLLLALCQQLVAFATSLTLAVAHSPVPSEVYWAYVAPQKREVRPLRHGVWGCGEMDRYVLAELERAGVVPSPAARPGVWLRRVTLDLTGLPPTPAEIAAFLADHSAEEKARVVDRLLASPHFGERWATPWLDLAHYADTQGYEKDNLRTTWVYRDWVILALNRDEPYDEFTRDQLAGDLVPQPSTSQLIATAFARQTMTNTEGGSVDEEFRVKAVVDRVNTVGTVWLGLTVGCAQCHDHPSAPLTQRDYYALYAFFNNTADCDRDDDAPVLSVVSPAREVKPGEAAPETLVPVMRELTGAARRTTHVLHRGQWQDARAEIGAATPSFLPAFPAQLSRDRLGLAAWLTSGRNPLTARAAVNRVWEQLFGAGLVETVEDLGESGAKPSNRALLDYLACRYAGDLHWSLKKLLREIVLSATYGQSSDATAEQRARDPRNRLLGRGPRFRLSAEMLRDQALAAAGLLSAKMYGRSVMPLQPEGVWSVVYNAQRWTTARGEDRFRRGLYTFWRRTSPYPSATAFDATSREACTPRRGRTNTPLAALTMLNDPVFVEAAEALGRRMYREGGATALSRLRYGWKLLLAEEASDEELAPLLELLAQAGDEQKGYALAASALLNSDAVLTKE